MRNKRWGKTVSKGKNSRVENGRSKRSLCLGQGRCFFVCVYFLMISINERRAKKNTTKIAFYLSKGHHHHAWMDAADDGRRDILNNKHTSVLEKALFRAEG
jgi:Fe-S-cluster-containing hydrogenase component 2